MTWNDRGKQLTIEPGAPAGATQVTAARVFRVVVLPAGTTRDVSYDGRRVQATF
jgi:hypothetical protein